MKLPVSVENSRCDNTGDNTAERSSNCNEKIVTAQMFRTGLSLCEFPMTDHTCDEQRKHVKGYLQQK